MSNYATIVMNYKDEQTKVADIMIQVFYNYLVIFYKYLTREYIIYSYNIVIYNIINY